MQDKKGFLSLVLNGMLLGTYGIWVRLLQYSFTGYQQVIARSIIAFILAVLIALLLKTKWGYSKKYHSHLALYLFCFAMSTILFTLGVIYTSIATGVFGLYIGSILSAFILGVIMFKEKITFLKAVSIAFVILALLTFILPLSGKILNTGLIISISAGIFDSIGNAFKKYFGGKIERPALIVFQTFSSLLVALGLTIFTHETFATSHLSLINIGMIVTYGGIFLAVAYLSMYGFQHFDLNLGTIIISSELFWAPFFALLIFHELLSSYQILGGVFIAAAILIPYAGTYKKNMLRFLKRDKIVYNTDKL